MKKISNNSIYWISLALLSPLSAEFLQFNQADAMTYSPANDQGQVQVSTDGKTITLIDNSWKSFPINFAVTEKTVVSFEFKADSPAEHFSFSLDDQNGSDPLRRLPIKFGGIHDAGIYAHTITDNQYQPGSGWVRYEFVIGTLYPNFTADRMAFIRDADSAPVRVGTSMFRNVEVYEARTITFDNLSVLQDANIDGDLEVSGNLTVEGKAVLTEANLGNGNFSAPNSLAGGTSSTASGTNALAYGDQAIASNTSSIAFGFNSKATGAYSFASGYSAQATKEHSFAQGFQALADGTHSFASSWSKARGSTSVAMARAEAIGHYSVALGRGSEYHGNNSVAMGRSKSHGSWSLSAGHNNETGSFAETALGSYNALASGNLTAWQPTDFLFSLGNGSMANDRSNAITTLKNGQTTLTSSYWDSTDPGAINPDPDASGSEALVVEGHAIFKGRLILENTQGDIPVYGE